MDLSHPDASEAAPGTSAVEAPGPTYWNAISHLTTRSELDALTTDDQLEQIPRARLRTSQRASQYESHVGTQETQIHEIEGFPGFLIQLRND